MSFTLTPELDRLVQQRLALGPYRSEEEVLQAALSALDVEDRIVATVEEGHADFEAGRFRSFDEADAAFREQNNIPRSA